MSPSSSTTNGPTLFNAPGSMAFPLWAPFRRAARIHPLVLFLILMLPARLFAQFDYTSDNGAITITGYQGSNAVVTIPDTIDGLPVRHIAREAFIHRDTLAEVILPNTLISIGDGAFVSAGITNVAIPEGVTSIGVSAFVNCRNLVGLTLPATITNIGVSAFQYCETLSSVVIPNSITSIESAVFAHCWNLANVVIPNSVTNIGVGSFVACTNLGQLTIPGSVTSIGDSAFGYCIGLTNLLISEGVNHLDVTAFGWCLGLTEVEIPDSVTDLAYSAFEHCSNLTNVFIGKGVTFNAGTFGFCSNLTTITMDAENETYTSVDGVLFSKDKTILVRLPEGRVGNYYIPNTVTTIGGGAFYNCIGLTGVTIPDGVTRIESAAFYACSGLASVIIPATVTSLGHSVFAYSPNHREIFFKGNSPTEVGSSLFGESSATVYYLPGVPGWGTEFAERATVLWLPRMKTFPLSLESMNQFGFDVQWASGKTVVVEACTSLAEPEWQPVQTNALLTDRVLFKDSQWTNYPNRFYRIRSNDY